MEPAYRHGDRLLVNRLAYLRTSPRRGDVVILRDPAEPGRLLLKRVSGRTYSGHIYVLGDNERESRDSRHFGAIPLQLILGRAWRTY
jgi:nickel-type superoxide dismutase maturation protease